MSKFASRRIKKETKPTCTCRSRAVGSFLFAVLQFYGTFSKLKITRRLKYAKEKTQQTGQKVSYPVLVDIPCKISKKVKDNRTYYNLSITIGDMTFDVRPVFLTFTQRQRLNHAIKRLTGEEQKNVK